MHQNVDLNSVDYGLQSTNSICYGMFLFCGNEQSYVHDVKTRVFLEVSDETQSMDSGCE